MGTMYWKPARIISTSSSSWICNYKRWYWCFWWASLKP